MLWLPSFSIYLAGIFGYANNCATGEFEESQGKITYLIKGRNTLLELRLSRGLEVIYTIYGKILNLYLSEKNVIFEKGWCEFISNKRQTRLCWGILMSSTVAWFKVYQVSFETGPVTSALSQNEQGHITVSSDLFMFHFIIWTNFSFYLILSIFISYIHPSRWISIGENTSQLHVFRISFFSSVNYFVSLIFGQMAQLFLNLDILSREMLVLLHAKLQDVYPSLTSPYNESQTR